MKLVTVELSDDGKRLWVYPAADKFGPEPSACIDIPKIRKLKRGEKSGNVGDACWPALSVGLAVQAVLAERGGAK